MSAVLVIRDGDPDWWNSPDIWVVPGTDPNGSPGQPVAGAPAYLWGRVNNAGDQPALGARVNFYWSNPAAGVHRSNSTAIGFAIVDLYPGETKEVLCVTPWIPQIVNEGHECIVGEIVHFGDPLPSPLPDAFHAPGHHQVAQKNLTVLVMQQSMMLTTIQVAGPIRKAMLVHFTVEAGARLDKQNLMQLGLSNYRPDREHSLKTKLSLEGGCEEPGRDDQQELVLSLQPGRAKAVYLKIWPRDIHPKSYIALHVVCRDEEKIIGGISYVLIRQKEQ